MNADVLLILCYTEILSVTAKFSLDSRDTPELQKI